MNPTWQRRVYNSSEVTQTIYAIEKGIIADGVTDNTVKLQALLDEAASQDYSVTIEFPIGVINFSSQLNVTNNTFLRGQRSLAVNYPVNKKNGSILQYTGTGNESAIYVNKNAGVIYRFGMVNLGINCSRSSAANSNGLNLVDCSEWFIDGCAIVGGFTNGLRLSSSDIAGVDGLYVNGATNNGVLIETSVPGLGGVSPLWFSRMNIWDCEESGVKIVSENININISDSDIEHVPAMIKIEQPAATPMTVKLKCTNVFGSTPNSTFALPKFLDIIAAAGDYRLLLNRISLINCGGWLEESDYAIRYTHNSNTSATTNVTVNAFHSDFSGLLNGFATADNAKFSLNHAFTRAGRYESDSYSTLCYGTGTYRDYGLPTREKLLAARTYYVRTDGSDSNNGLANTSAGAFLTIQKAVNVARDLDFGGYDVTIQVADGTYTAGIALDAPLVGKGNLIVQGNSSTPTNVIMNSSGSIAVSASNSAAITVKNMEIRGSSRGLAASYFGVINHSNLVFGACNIAQYAVSGGIINATGNYAVSAGGLYMWYANGAQIITNSRTVTFSNTPTFSQQVVLSQNTAQIVINSCTWAGDSVTGTRYRAALNGIIDAGGAAASLPGSVAGAVVTGGQAS